MANKDMVFENKKIASHVLRKALPYPVVVVDVPERTAPPQPKIDKRTGFSKNRQVVETLLTMGFKREDIIGYEDVQYAIEVNRGSDPRTIRQTFEQLVRLDFLEPCGLPIEEKKYVKVRCTSERTREYSILKCSSRYRFGLRAPVGYQATLENGVRASNNLEGVESEKNVCVVDGKGVSVGEGVS